MKETIFLTCNKYGIRSLRKTPPPLGKGEIAVKLTLTVPSKVFEDFIPSAEITIPEESVIRPSVQVQVEEHIEEEESE